MKKEIMYRDDKGRFIKPKKDFWIDHSSDVGNEEVDANKVIDIWCGGTEEKKPYPDELVEFTRNVILVILLMVVTIYIGVRI